MNRKLLALLLCLCMAAALLPVSIAFADGSAAASLGARAKLDDQQPAALETKSDPQPKPVPDGVCDVCGAAVNKSELTVLPCGDHQACAACSATSNYFTRLHTAQLPCGAYACDGRLHQTAPMSEFCDAEHKHYACEEPDATHACPSCGAEYLCNQCNAHAVCSHCGGRWCTGSHGFCVHCGDYYCAGDHGPCTVEGCGMYNCQLHYHCPACNAICESFYGHDRCDECGWYSCQGHASDCPKIAPPSPVPTTPVY